MFLTGSDKGDEPVEPSESMLILTLNLELHIDPESKKELLFTKFTVADKPPMCCFMNSFSVTKADHAASTFPLTFSEVHCLIPCFSNAFVSFSVCVCLQSRQAGSYVLPQ